MKILLITPNFFNYHKMIIEELESMGHSVDWFDDRPSTSGWVKAIIRVKRDLLSLYIKKYFQQIRDKVSSNHYDVFFLISGQSLSLSESMIKEIRSLQPDAKFVLYQWDSVKNFPYIKKMQKHFDRCFSFDRGDADDDKISFLPLFYGKKFAEIGKAKDRENQYDFCFVGTAHPKKYKLVKEMSEQLGKVYKKQFIYFFLPSRIVYFYRKFHDREMLTAKYSEFHFTSLPPDVFNNVYVHSECILDSPQAGQNGLTIRVIETMGAKKKLITTNPDIVNYDFYQPENIYVYEGNFDFSSPFFSKAYVDLPTDVYEKYSLNNWLRTVLED